MKDGLTQDIVWIESSQNLWSSHRPEGEDRRHLSLVPVLLQYRQT